MRIQLYILTLISNFSQKMLWLKIKISLQKGFFLKKSILHLVIDKFWGGNTFSNQQYTMHDGFNGNKSDGVQTSNAFWRSACVLVSELSFKWHSFMFLVLFGSILVEISYFSEIQLVCDWQKDGWTDRRERIWKRVLSLFILYYFLIKRNFHSTNQIHYIWL